MGKKYVAAEKSNGPVCANESDVAPGNAKNGKLGAKMVVEAASANKPKRTAHSDRCKVWGQHPLGCKVRTDASSMKLLMSSLRDERISASLLPRDDNGGVPWTWSIMLEDIGCSDRIIVSPVLVSVDGGWFRARVGALSHQQEEER